MEKKQAWEVNEMEEALLEREQVKKLNKQCKQQKQKINHVHVHFWFVSL